MTASPCTPEVIGATPTPGISVAVDDTHVYWSADPSNPTRPVTGAAVYRVAKTGGVASSILTAPFGDFRPTDPARRRVPARRQRALVAGHAPSCA